MVKNKGKTQVYEKHCKNNEKLLKFDEKQCKNNEKIMKRFGSRTSTRTSRFSANARARARALAERLARGLRPIHPGERNGGLQRGIHWETKWKTKKSYL